MKTVMILRHAKSSREDETLPDHDRPLNKRGLTAAPQMGKLVHKEDLEPELVLTSSALRARTTAELFAEACHLENEIVVRPDLYSFEPGPYLKALSAVADQYSRVMLVGHNPACEELLQALTGELQPVPTAAVAVIELPIEHWNEVPAVSSSRPGKLLHLWRPKEI
jgi:phosphohistidine phosphatase